LAVCGAPRGATRAFCAQNVKSAYAFSDFPFPPEVPEFPTGEQVQAYLEAYVGRFGLADRLRLGTEVVAAELDEAAGTWTLETADGASDTFDHFVVATRSRCATSTSCSATSGSTSRGRRGCVSGCWPVDPRAYRSI
jgi:predicted NAD/FAD-binding protein